jgi:hypothetical protein
MVWSTPEAQEEALNEKAPDPVQAGWFDKGTAAEAIAGREQVCELCETTTPHTEYRVWGLPKLLRRKQPKVRAEEPAHWSMCHECQSLYPIDERAHHSVRSLGLVTGFINR